MKRMAMWVGAVGALAAAVPAAADGPEISRSHGSKSGVVVMAARVVPATDDATLQELGDTLQSELSTIVGGGMPDAKLMLRPRPERVCPYDGCKGPSVTPVLLHQEGGCAALVLVQPPGTVDGTMIAWAAELEVSNPDVPFREPPEERVTVHDFVPCGDLAGSLSADAVGAVQGAVQSAMP